MLDYHGVAVGGEGLKFGQSPRLFPFVFSASAPKGGRLVRRSTGICDKKFVALRLGRTTSAAWNLFCFDFRIAASRNASPSFIKNLRFGESIRWNELIKGSL